MKKFISSSIFLLSFIFIAVPVFAENNNERTTINSECMKSAIEVRDTAIIGALDTFSGKVRSALMTRKDTLKTSWDLSGKPRRDAIKSAWRIYNTSIKSAKQEHQSARRAAWTAFHTARAACGDKSPSEQNMEVVL